MVLIKLMALTIYAKAGVLRLQWLCLEAKAKNLQSQGQLPQILALKAKAKPRTNTTGMYALGITKLSKCLLMS